jgi:hypothetical protein
MSGLVREGKEREEGEIHTEVVCVRFDDDVPLQLELFFIAEHLSSSSASLLLAHGRENNTLDTGTPHRFRNTGT